MWWPCSVDFAKKETDTVGNAARNSKPTSTEDLQARLDRLRGRDSTADPAAAHQASAKSSEGSKDGGPFRALAGAGAVVAAVLAAGGFSLRWNYYYNFGLQSLVLQTPLATLPIYAIEVIRNPDSIQHFLWLLAYYLLPLQLLFVVLECARRCRWRAAAPLRVLERIFGLNSPIVADTLRAGAIIYVAFLAGGEAGFRTFRLNAVEATSKLPRVTLTLLSDRPEAGLPIHCDMRPFGERRAPKVSFLGDDTALEFLNGGGACSSALTGGRSWRLLHRDEKFIYIFATTLNDAERPNTIVIAQNDKFVLVLR